MKVEDKLTKYFAELEDGRSINLRYDEILDLYSIVQNDIKLQQFKGLHHERTKYAGGFKESVFAKKWIEINTQQAFLNHGLGVLESLFHEVNVENGREVERFLEDINERDRMVTSTVVQWLGTNYGWEFLEHCINECGYKLEKK